MLIELDLLMLMLILDILPVIAMLVVVDIVMVTDILMSIDEVAGMTEALLVSVAAERGGTSMATPAEEQRVWAKVRASVQMLE
jgi:hypothetical protein